MVKIVWDICSCKVREELQKLCPDQDCVLPPWIAFPMVDSSDLFWKMGRGEDYIMAIINYYRKDPQAYELQFPAPQSWKEFY